MYYFERYEAGEHEAVWNELRALGAGLFDGPHLDEARQVAAATMLRVSANLARVAAGLRELRYEFVTLSPPPVDVGAVNAAVMNSAAGSLLSHPGIGPEQARQMLASLPGFLGGLHGDASAEPARPAEPSVIIRSSAVGDPGRFASDLGEYEAEVGPLPLSLGAFWRLIGTADFTCRNPDGTVLLSWQPLVVQPPLGLADDHAEWADDGNEGPFMIELVPDPIADDGYGGPLVSADLSPGADCRLGSGEWFVDHLRRMTRSACFGGAASAEMPPAIALLAAAWEPF